jgi:hypothetical protein
MVTPLVLATSIMGLGDRAASVGRTVQSSAAAQLADAVQLDACTQPPGLPPICPPAPPTPINTPLPTRVLQCMRANAACIAQIRSNPCDLLAC